MSRRVPIAQSARLRFSSIRHLLKGTLLHVYASAAPSPRSSGTIPCRIQLPSRSGGISANLSTITARSCIKTGTSARLDGSLVAALKPVTWTSSSSASHLWGLRRNADSLQFRGARIFRRRSICDRCRGCRNVRAAGTKSRQEGTFQSEAARRVGPVAEAAISVYRAAPWKPDTWTARMRTPHRAGGGFSCAWRSRAL